MVAKITSPHDIKRALNYNEQKVKKGQAICLYAGNFIQDTNRLNFYQKLSRFTDLISLNERTQKSNTLHISLNFDPSEKLDQDALTAIAKVYMEKIGFGSQPYLVYEHQDAGHPHIHIVTTNIQPDGKRMDTYNIGRNQSEKARIEIEAEFDLVQAAGRGQVRKPDQEYLGTGSIRYGKSETKQSIVHVLNQVLDRYKYTSLSSLNAILNEFNVLADPGKEGGRIHKHGGLLYHILDENGRKVGVPIKASSIYSHPTLGSLESKFQVNGMNRKPDRQFLKEALDAELSKSPKSIKDLISGLQKKNIHALLRQNEKGFLFGITFVDHRTKSVFNGSEIGKLYSIRALQNMVDRSSDLKALPQSQCNEKDARGVLPQRITRKVLRPEKSLLNYSKQAELLKSLLQEEGMNSRLPFEFKSRRRKRKRKRKL